MELEIGHHIELKNLTMEQYHAFCKKAISQGFEAGEYGKSNNSYYIFKHVGIGRDGALYHSDCYFSEEYPDMLLTIEHALEDFNDTAKTQNLASDFPDFDFTLTCGDISFVRQWLKDNGCTWASGRDLTSNHFSNEKFLEIEDKKVICIRECNIKLPIVDVTIGVMGWRLNHDQLVTELEDLKLQQKELEDKINNISAKLNGA